MAFRGIRGGPVDRGSFERFRDSINPVWIDAALTLTGTATVRKRRLPAEQVVWLVLGMALFRNLSIEEVVRELDLALPGSAEVVPSAIAQARQRLGAAPMQWLFERTAEVWAHQSADKLRWRGLAVYGVDGTTVRVPDSDANYEAFGGPTNGAGRHPAGYPVTRLVTLMALRSHLLVGARFGPYAKHEVTYAAELWEKIPDDSLTIVDRGFLSAKLLFPLASEGRNRHWLIRAKSNQKLHSVRALGSGDALVEMTISPQARQQDDSIPEDGKWQMRAVRYQRRGFRPQTLLTSLLDSKRFPAKEIVALYHERWELELGFDEVKTDMLEREETIRSRKPEGVKQELWGLLLAYNLVRKEMEQIAREAGVPPSRISFIAGLRLIRTSLLAMVFASPGVIPKRLKQLRADVAYFVLPERRSHRAYPRAVKTRGTTYPIKRDALRRSVRPN